MRLYGSVWFIANAINDHETRWSLWMSALLFLSLLGLNQLTRKSTQTAGGGGEENAADVWRPAENVLPYVLLCSKYSTSTQKYNNNNNKPIFSVISRLLWLLSQECVFLQCFMRISLFIKIFFHLIYTCTCIYICVLFSLLYFIKKFKWDQSNIFLERRKIWSLQRNK